MARPKGQPKYGGRLKGTINKTTRESKELLTTIIEGQIPHIKTALVEVFEKDKALYLKSIAGLLPYFLPKKTDITSNDGELNHLPIIIDWSGTTV